MNSKIDVYQVSLKVLLNNSRGQTLVLKAGNGSYAGYYDLPGGRIDVDEFQNSFEEILEREIKEEVGDISYCLQKNPVAIGRHSFPSVIDLTQDIHVLYLFFKAEYLGGDVKISFEHTGRQWLDLKQINLSDYFTSGILEGITMYCQNN